jgi:tryptophan 2,3-dioxygenase
MLRVIPNDVDLYVQLPPDDNKHRDKIFIVDHQCCEVYLDPVVEEFTYLLSGDNLLVPSSWDDPIEVSRCFVESINKMFKSCTDYTIIENLTTLLPLSEMAEEFREDYGIHWDFITFFHNDEDTKKVFRLYQNKDQALEARAKRREEFAAYPFIKQVEVPYAMVMDYKYLDGLVGIQRT